MMLRNPPRLLRGGLLLAGLALPATAFAQQAPADRQDAALAYAQCMRDNGYAEFPDPDTEGGFQFLIEPGSAPRFHAAADACKHLTPEGLRDDGITPEQLDALLKLSQCIRDNGIADFPDPDAKGTYDLGALGIGPGDARLDAAMDACGQLREGVGRIVIGG